MEGGAEMFVVQLLMKWSSQIYQELGLHSVVVNVILTGSRK